MNKIDRRKFLNNVCPAIAISIVGASFLESCSKDDAVDNKLRKLQSDEEKEKTKNLSSVHKFLNQPPINT